MPTSRPASIQGGSASSVNQLLAVNLKKDIIVQHERGIQEAVYPGAIAGTHGQAIELLQYGGRTMAPIVQQCRAGE